MNMIITDSKLQPYCIHTLYAAIAVDREKNHEGIVAQTLEGLGTTPIVFSNPLLLENMKPLLRILAQETGKTIMLRTFVMTDEQVLE